jgi:hypothetical protein
MGTLASALAAAPAVAGSLARVDVVARSDAATLPVFAHGGRHWIVGTPGQEYSIRICNSTDGRLLAVTSVDGVNVITGETAAPHQSGYVVEAYACVDIAGWRKSMARTAAFYFTELPDAYAARTTRPGSLAKSMALPPRVGAPREIHRAMRRARATRQLRPLRQQRSRER